MNFDFSDDLKQLREQARRFLRERCPPTAVRRILEGRRALRPGALEGDRRPWAGPAPRFPKQYGGAGLGHLALCVLAEELGRAVAPVPFSSSVYLATEAHHAGGSEAQKKEVAAEAGDAARRSARSRSPKARATPSAASCARAFRGGALQRRRSCRCPTATSPTSPSSSRRASAARRARHRRSERHRRHAARRVETHRPDAARMPRIAFDSAPRRGCSARRARAGPASGAARPRRGAVRLRAGRRRAGCLEMARDYALRALRLRPPDRLVPGDQAQAGRRLRRDRAGALQRLLRRLGAAHATPPNCRSPRPPRASRPPRPTTSRPRRTSRPTAAWASPGSSTASSTTAARSCCRWRSAARGEWKDRLITELRNEQHDRAADVIVTEDDVMDFNDTPEEAAFRAEARAFLRSQRRAPQARRRWKAIARGNEDAPRCAWSAPRTGRPRRPTPASPASPGRRSGAAAAARRSSR